MPDIKGLRPEDLGGEDFLKHMCAGHPSLAKTHAGEPFEWRPAAVQQGDDPTKYRVRGYCRSQTPLPRDRTTNLAALAYVSDKRFIGTALHANPEAVGERMRNLATAASLTHTLCLFTTQTFVSMSGWSPSGMLRGARRGGSSYIRRSGIWEASGLCWTVRRRRWFG
ncbi:hypothetical protein Hte_002421 [Hypoxylon texense]